MADFGVSYRTALVARMQRESADASAEEGERIIRQFIWGFALGPLVLIAGMFTIIWHIYP